MTIAISKEQLGILQHALGLDQYGQGAINRNFFCAGDADEGTCKSLVEIGYMRRHVTTEMYPYYNCSVTPEGIEAVKRESPPPPKLTRAQRRYRDYLKADVDRPFGEWLKDTFGAKA